MPKLKLPPAGMSKKNIPGIDTLVVMWSPEHIVPINSKIQLSNPGHPMHEVTKRKWEARTDPLWWNCLSSKQASLRKIGRAHV